MIRSSRDLHRGTLVWSDHRLRNAEGIYHRRLIRRIRSEIRCDSGECFDSDFGSSDRYVMAWWDYYSRGGGDYEDGLPRYRIGPGCDEGAPEALAVLSSDERSQREGTASGRTQRARGAVLTGGYTWP